MNTTIGVLDSGVGGLSVLREIHRQHPHLTTLYYGDQAHLPYGERSHAEIQQYVEAISAFLIGQGAAAIVIACHAASAGGLYAVRARFPDVPFVGIEPAVKPAAAATQTGVIGVLTTQATADGALYRSVVQRHASGVRVLTQVAPELVLLAEAGAPDTADSRAVVAAAVAPLLAANADQIVLACTHFPFLALLLYAVMGERAALVDPGAAVARQVGRVLGAAALATNGSRPLHRYYTSGDAGAFAVVAQRLLGVDIQAEASPC
jgi:glutamate racemase